MHAIYLFCLVVGGGLLLVTLIGGLGDIDADLETDVDVDGWSGLGEFLSVRTLTYLLAGFGATGAILDGLTDTSAIVTLLVALAVGFLSAAAAGATYRYLRSSESGTVARDGDYLVGLPATVTHALEPGCRGKIRLLAAGREVELLARMHDPDEAPCVTGATVVIVDIDAETALVTAAPALETETS